MSNLSIFDKKWIDVVFDGKNKEYGAYKLRQESEKTSLQAFAYGSMIVLSLFGIFTLSSFFDAEKVIPIDIPGTKITPVCVFPVIEKPKPIIEKTKSTKTFTEDVILKDPIVSKNVPVNDSFVKASDVNKVSNNPETPNTGTLPENPSNGNATGTVAVITPKVPDVTVKSIKELDEKPSFPNGIDKFYSYAGNNFNKPELEDEKTVTVKVSFIVEKDGTMSNIKVLDDPGYGLGNEAIRVLKSLKTRWNPGKLAGEPMRTMYNLPITVKLE